MFHGCSVQDEGSIYDKEADISIILKHLRGSKGNEVTIDTALGRAENTIF